MQREDTNPLNPFAAVAALSIVVDAYHIGTSHHVTWFAVLRTVLFVPFLFFYVRRSRLAWLASVIAVSTITPLYLIVDYVAPPSKPAPLGFILAIFIAGVVYAFAFRKRYYAFVDSVERYRAADTQTSNQAMQLTPSRTESTSSND